MKSCRRCAGRDFAIRRDKSLKRGLTRECVPCRRRRGLAWKKANLDAVRLRDRKNAKRRRNRMILAMPIDEDRIREGRENAEALRLSARSAFEDSCRNFGSIMDREAKRQLRRWPKRRKPAGKLSP